MPFTDVDRVRRLIGESIPADGSEADTMFTNDQIQDMLDSVVDGNLTRAALEGWKAKAAEYANLVTVSEGNSMRQMSDLHKNALAMIKKFEGDVAVIDNEGKRGRVTIGTISRARQYR